MVGGGAIEVFIAAVTAIMAATVGVMGSLVLRAVAAVEAVLVLAVVVMGSGGFNSDRGKKREERRRWQPAEKEKARAHHRLLELGRPPTTLRLPLTPTQRAKETRVAVMVVVVVVPLLETMTTGTQRSTIIAVLPTPFP